MVLFGRGTPQNPLYLHAGEADEVGTDAEARTLACRHADGW